jgi:hypothetical protein
VHVVGGDAAQEAAIRERFAGNPRVTPDLPTGAIGLARLDEPSASAHLALLDERMLDVQIDVLEITRRPDAPGGLELGAAAVRWPSTFGLLTPWGAAIGAAHAAWHDARRRNIVAVPRGRRDLADRVAVGGPPRPSG